MKMLALLKRLTVMFALLFLPQGAAAQFVPETQTREIHILKSEEGDTKIILRFPLILAYANELARHQAGTDLSAPFIVNTKTAGQQVFRLDSNAILDDYAAFSDFLLRDFKFSVNGQPITPEMPEYVVIDSHDLGDVGVNIGLGLTSSSSMLTLCVSDYPVLPDIAETLIVISFYLDNVMPDDPIRIALEAVPFSQPDGALFETRIIDYRNGRADSQIFQGVVFEPVLLASGVGALQDIVKRYGLILLLLLAVVGFVIFWRGKTGTS